jgi:hypothetical protein
VLWCTPEYAENVVRDRHCRHHPPPGPDTGSLILGLAKRSAFGWASGMRMTLTAGAD